MEWVGRWVVGHFFSLAGKDTLVVSVPCMYFPEVLVNS